MDALIDLKYYCIYQNKKKKKKKKKKEEEEEKKKKQKEREGLKKMSKYLTKLEPLC